MAEPTWVGTSVVPVVVPSPVSPYSLLPQAHSVPLVRTAREWWLPPAAAVAQLVAVPTWVGTTVLPVVVPSPVAPYSLLPHDHRVPLVRTAREWKRKGLAAAVAQLVAVPTWVGTSVPPLVVPSPVAPCSFWPQVHRVPLLRTAKE